MLLRLLALPYFMIQDILIFMMEEEDKEDSTLPPLYCDPDNFSQNRMFLEWIVEKSNTDLKEDIGFQFYSLPALLHEMTHLPESPSDSGSSKSSSRRTGNSNEPSLTMAGVQLGRDTFMFQTESCEWHQEGESGRYYCCKSRVLSLSYIFLSLVCPLFSVPLRQGSHKPVGYSGPDLSSSRESTRDVSDSEDNLSLSSQCSSSSRSGSYSRPGSGVEVCI